MENKHPFKSSFLNEQVAKGNLTYNEWYRYWNITPSYFAKDLINNSKKISKALKKEGYRYSSTFFAYVNW